MRPRLPCLQQVSSVIVTFLTAARIIMTVVRVIASPGRRASTERYPMLGCDFKTISAKKTKDQSIVMMALPCPQMRAAAAAVCGASEEAGPALHL
jgi:hypothetical protein